MEVLTNDRQIVFDKALGQMFRQHFYLAEYTFPSSDRFEGWVYTYNRNQYHVIISEHFSCSCQPFRENDVCKHFLFVLKRVFNVNFINLLLYLIAIHCLKITILF